MSPQAQCRGTMSARIVTLSVPTAVNQAAKAARTQPRRAWISANTAKLTCHVLKALLWLSLQSQGGAAATNRT